MVEQIVVLIIVGFIIGGFGGLLGIGGGTVMVPVLRLGFALEAVCATATSLFTIIFTSIGGTITHLRNKTCIPKLSICLGVGGAVTSSLGAYLGNISPGWTVMFVAALIIFYSASTMLRKALSLKPQEGGAGPSASSHPALGTSAVTGTPSDAAPGLDSVAGQDAVATPAAEDQQVYDFGFKRGFGGLGIGLIAGLASGYVGVGGGFIMVPLMTAWLGVPMRKASGTSLIAIMILAIPGVATQMMLGNVDYTAGICLAIGSIPGAMVGARFVKSIPERQLRFIFAGFLCFAGLMLVLNELGVLG